MCADKMSSESKFMRFLSVLGPEATLLLTVGIVGLVIKLVS